MPRTRCGGTYRSCCAAAAAQAQFEAYIARLNLTVCASVAGAKVPS
jgi:predicted metal-binding protein